MTDLLPAGLSWANPAASANFSVTKGRGGTAVQVAGTLLEVPNFESTGQELIRITLPAAAFTAGYYTITAPTNLIDLTVPAGAGTYNNTAQLFVQGIGQNTLSTCGPGTTTVAATFESSDPLDLDDDGATTENYCQWAASLTVPPSGPPAFSVVKSVQGDQDVAPKFSPGIGDAAQGGSGTYTLTWTSTGGAALSNPVIYDILPYVGDTGVSQGQSTVARDSQFAPTFASITGTLPSGVTVAYSLSTNPCRPEVFPNGSNPTCINDWSTTLPADPTTVKALRFTAIGTYAPAASFAVAFTVNVPTQFVNLVAWNSAAADAVVTSSGAALLPAEGPEVGLTAPASPLLPALATSASSALVSPGDPFSDAVSVTNTGGASGTLAWQLVGPVAPEGNGSCDNADWSPAATFDTGTIAVTGDGSYTTAVDSPTAAGCYSYVDTLNGGAWLAPVATVAGGAGETVLVAVPALSTTVSSTSVLTGGPVDDSIVVDGTGGQPGAITWALLGPVTPAAGGGCDGISWSRAATAAQGTLAVTGDGPYTTPTAKLADAGCYSYAATLSGASYGPSVVSAAGASGEIVEAKTQTTTSTPGPSRVDLTVTKNVDERTTTFGKPLTYTLIVGNAGPDTATDVKVTDVPVTKLRLVSARSADGSCGHSFPLVCRLRELPAHHHSTVTIVAIPQTVGDVVNAAHVTTADPNSASPRSVISDAHTNVLATLKLAQRAQTRSVQAGGLAAFTITVANPMAAVAKHERVCDRLPRGLSFASASVRTSLRSGAVCWTIAAIGPRGHSRATMVVHALGGSSGQLINHATLSGPAVVRRFAAATIRVIAKPPTPTPVTG